jgi:3'-phosphoadenosine 5'-phosphosulfate sulfotransferase (PAPS reductase)/FAD synthetase
MPLFLIETTIDNPKQLEWIDPSPCLMPLNWRGATLVEYRNTDTRDRMSLGFEHDNEKFLRTTILLVDPSAEFAEVRQTVSTGSIT